MTTSSAESAANSERNRQLLANHSHAAGIGIASHDDATREHVQESVSLGVALAEFPTTIEAATLSRNTGLHVLIGAPECGKKHFTVAMFRPLTCSMPKRSTSCSSVCITVPSGLVQAAFLLANRADISLPNAIRLISANPDNSPSARSRSYRNRTACRSGAVSGKTDNRLVREFARSGARGFALLKNSRCDRRPQQQGSLHTRRCR